MKLKRTGEVLVIRGPAPKRPGDRFQAAPIPAKGQEPVEAPARGCVTGTLPGGGTFIACSRGRAGFGSPADPAARTYRYDPALHEVVR